MQVSLSHNLGREEARRRLRDHAHELAGGVPGGMAQVETSWPSDDRMDMTVTAMGQAMRGDIAIGDSDIVITLNLPMALSFFEPMISGAIRDQGQKLLA